MVGKVMKSGRYTCIDMRRCGDAWYVQQSCVLRSRVLHQGRPLQVVIGELMMTASVNGYQVYQSISTGTKAKDLAVCAAHDRCMYPRIQFTIS